MSYQSVLKQMREYRIWTNMKTRCLNKRSPAYPRYGGRGITICDRWKNKFADFLSDMGRCPDGWTIERVDNDKGYSPENCVWATPLQQCQNRIGLRKIQGKTVAEWSRITGISQGTIRSRLKLGWPEAKVFDPITSNRKLAPENISYIRMRVQLGVTHQDVADEFGVDRSTITAVMCGKNWRVRS